MTIGVAAASLSAGAALTYGAVKLVDWLMKPKALPAPPHPLHRGQEADIEADDDTTDDVDMEDDREPEPVRAPPRRAKPEPTRAAPHRQQRAPRRGPVFIPKPAVDPEPVVEPWMMQWAQKVAAGIKAQELNRK